jgi:hypothetical protein
MIDLRRVRVSIEVNGKLHIYEDLKMAAAGTKFTNPLQNECTVVMTGLNSDTRDFLLTATSPYNKDKAPARIIVEAGRVSTGLFTVYQGDIVSAEVGAPPDVDLTIKAKTNNANSMKIITASGGATTKLSAISGACAQNNGLGLIFEAVDKLISNYSYSGSASKQIQDLQSAGGVSAFVDDKTLIVKDSGAAVSGRRRVLNMNSGLVGIPKSNEKGAEITYLIDGDSLIGGQIELDSRFNKSLNGTYKIDQLKFAITTHDDAFFFIAQCSRL